jgi:Cu(I)/Ag(I) efflux system membrane fusion protein
MSEFESPSAPDAPEPPPRGVLVMSIVRWILLLAMTALAVWAVRKYGLGGERGTQTAREARYYCPMHPQITSPDPGECPICHMTLEPIPRDRGVPTGPMGATGPDGGVDHDHDHDHDHDASVGAGDASAADASVMLSLERRQAIDVATAPVERRAMREPLRVPAVIAARENAVTQVHVRSPAFVERVAVRETGGRVGAGDVLAWIYSPAIYRAQQDLFTASRWSVGAGDGGAAAESSRMMGAARESLRLLGVSDHDIDVIVRSGAPMRQVPVRSVGSGIVTQRAAVPGLYAQPETVLYEVTDLSRVWVVASVFERDLPRIHRGDLVRFHAAGEGTDVDARVMLIEPTIDPATRTARVRLEVSNPGTRWRPGAFGEVQFTAASRDALVVPRDAVIDTGEARYVFVDAGEGRFEARRVETGSTIGESTEVTSGLREGERVVTRGAFLIDAETRLRSAVSPGGAP